MNLAQAIGEFGRRPFKWGDVDCCLFVAKVIDAVYGVDIGSEFQYDTRKGMIEILRPYGSLEALVDDRLGESIPLEDARDGDVGMLKTDYFSVLGVIWSDSVVFKTPNQVILYEPTICHKIWRVI